MVPGKLTIFYTFVLLLSCAVQDSVSQNALGRFNGLPLNCYSCTGADCTSNGRGKLGKCEGRVDQACATVFATDGSVIARGCSDAVTETCNAASNTCMYCQSSACNEATSLSEYVECISCDTTTDKNCFYDVTKITSKRQCLGGCITSLFPRDKTDLDSALELARTCLDDLDLDDRETCLGGSTKACVSCTTPNCNTAKVPETPRLKCYICEEDCADFEEMECPAYRVNDECFAQFDSENNLVRLSCRSSLDKEYEVENKRSIYYCSGENCNLITPAATTCAACSSENDVSCASNPLLVPSKVCNRFPYTQCATYMDENGIVLRDCLYDVLEDNLFDKCLSSENNECTLCNSNNCNKEVFPADRLSCLQCDSSSDTACDTGLSTSAAYCAIYAANDMCVTQVDNGITRRGCQSQMPCDTDDTENCRTCSGANCNTVNLIKNQVGEPGKWQDLPLSCYTCKGVECATGTGTSQVCAGNNVQNCMTVFATNGTVIARGCSDAVLLANRDFCDANEDSCFACKSNNCNNALQKSEYIECYFCDSAISDNCVTSYGNGRTRKCKGACMVSLYAATVSENPAYEFERSCLDDKEIVDQNTCKSGTDKNCLACTTNKCNIQSLPENRLSCFKCNDDSCTTQSAQLCRTYQPDDQCFISYDNSIENVVSMGCRSEYAEETIEILTKSKKFWVCDGNNCNDLSALPTPKSCLVCNSLTDKRCISNPAALSTFQTCSDVPYVECMTRVSKDGTTQRGCLNSLEADTFYNCLKGKDNLCSPCTGDNCNAVAEFPANRLRCQQCNGETDANCATAPSNLDVCPLYDPEDSCVTTIQNTYTMRGCNSTLKCENPQDSAACRTCGTNGCNTVNLERNYQQGAPGRWQASLPISCHTCSGEANCATLSTPVACQNNINQQCYTVFNTNGQVTQRGCRDTVLAEKQTYCDENPERCLGCNSNGCNSVTAYTDYVDCLFCDTERDGKCVNSVAGITTTRKCNKQCVTALYPRSKETNPAYGLSRSCLDDLEAADQAACIAGTKQNCRACTGTKCNTVAIPEKRISCYQCNGNACVSPVSQQCAQYSENDVCYTQYDETGAIARLGCRSDYTTEMANYLVSQKYLITCEGENCNSKDVVPPTYTCALCNSRTDSNCAASPDKVTSATKCAKLPYTDCYTRILTDGATERGCVSSLQDDEFLKCIMGQAENCLRCSGDNCNNKLYPTARLSCHICDSSKDPTCANNPNQLSVCPIYDKDQKCVSTYNNGITYRGCSAELLCDAENACETCATDGCNTADVAKASDKNFGKWQDLPLTCWNCIGAECLSTTISEKQCANNNLQDCLTVFDDNGVVVRRGCSDEVSADATYGAWCKSNPDKCYNCKSNKCNSANSQNEFTSCVYCDSYSNPNCLYQVSAITERRKCQGGCMTALYAAFTSETPSYELIRTCINDKETKDQQSCFNGMDSHCKACNTTADCNVVALPESRLSCYQCNGENCDEPVSKACPLYKPDDQCYTLFDKTNSVAQQGCLSSLMDLSMVEIVATKRIQLCDKENCNTFENIPKPHQCIVCDSTDDANCATNAQLIATLKTCTQLPYTSCYNLLLDDGNTQRGCVSDLITRDLTKCLLDKDGKCEVCEGDGCNREIFPANRLQCYTCNSNEDKNCEKSPTDLRYCTLFNDKTTCATALLGEDVTVRGCSDDVLCDANDRSTCQLCGSSGCNNKDLKTLNQNQFGVWQDLPLKCYTCEGEQCLNSLGASQQCDTNIYQDCMTVFDAEGKVKRRGCSDAVESSEAQYCRENPEKCFKCKSNECNIAWSLEEYVACVSCNSASDPRCADLPMNVEFDTRLCYKSCMVAQKDSTIIRSCLDDKEILDQPTCTDTNYDECASCQTTLCNEFVFPRDKLSCHVCSNSGCTTSVSKECEYSLEGNNFCIAIYENNKPNLLGCASDQNQENLDDWATKEKLYKCLTSDCNELKLLPTPITCVSCNSTAQCAQAPDQVTARATCDALVPECYSLVYENGKTARGCVSDLTVEEEYNCSESGSCGTCKTPNCNNKVYPEDRRRCYVCSSATDSRCTKDVSSSGFAQVCELYDKNDLCVTRVVNGQVERGCSSSLECNINDSKSCAKCDGNNCNTAELDGDCDENYTPTARPPTPSPDSGASAFTSISALLLASVIALILSSY